jgi:hypothetical protein
MASINTGRVVAGGLLAGVVANICDTVWSFTVVKDDMAGIAQKFGTDPSAMTSAAGILPWILVDFILGFVIVFTYAGMRPRFGPGPKTAVIAGLVSFIAASAVVYGFTSMGMMSMGAYVRGSATSLASVVIGSLAGCWAYKEA